MRTKEEIPNVPRYRHVLEAFKDSGLTASEFAKEAGISIGSVRDILGRAISGDADKVIRSAKVREGILSVMTANLRRSTSAVLNPPMPDNPPTAFQTNYLKFLLRGDITNCGFTKQQATELIHRARIIRVGPKTKDSLGELIHDYSPKLLDYTNWDNPMPKEVIQGILDAMLYEKKKEAMEDKLQPT